MPPPIAPWLYRHDPDALARGIQSGLAIRNQRLREKMEDDLRQYRRDQLEALKQYHKDQLDLRRSLGADAMQKFEDRNQLLQAQNVLRGRHAKAAEDLAATRENERIDRANEPRTTVNSQGLGVTRYPDGTFETFDASGQPGKGNKVEHVGNEVWERDAATGDWKMLFKAGQGRLDAVGMLDLRDAYNDRRDARKALNALTDKSPAEDRLLAMKQLDEAQKRINRIVASAPGTVPAIVPKTTLPASGVTPPSPGAALTNALLTPTPTMSAPVAPQIEPAPVDAKLRKPGSVYQTGKGNLMWTGTGWKPPGAFPAVAPVARDGLLAPEPTLDSGDFDYIRQLMEPDEEGDLLPVD